MAKLTAQRKGTPVDYRSILQKTKQWSAEPEGRRVYGHISALSKRFVTTNYDEWLDLVLPQFELSSDAQSDTDDKREDEKRTPLHRPEDMTAEKFSKANTVVHLHGALAEPSGMILSTSDYIGRYASDRHRTGGTGENAVLTFLEFLFKEKTVLFLGYGLEELEILEYVIMKARSAVDAQNREARHYLLQGFFSFEAEVCNALQDYFLQECGIQLIPFSRDENDWGQLVPVLEAFAKALPASDGMIVQELKEMEDFLRG